MLLLGFDEQVMGITCLSRCVGAQGDMFFPWSVGARERNLWTRSIKNRKWLGRVMKVHTHDYI